MFADDFQAIKDKLFLRCDVDKIVLSQYQNPIIILAKKSKKTKKQTKLKLIDKNPNVVDFLFPKPIHEKEVLDGDSPLIGEIPEQLQMFLKLIKYKTKAEQIGLSIPNILLVGPPGSGKSHFARRIAHLSNLRIAAISAATIHSSKFVGDNIKMIDEVFAKGQNGIVFIDELDAIGNRVLTSTRGDSHRTESITHLLSKLDGFEKKSPTIVIGATNDVKSIDEALLRNGRFDRIVQLGLPNEATIAELLKFYSKPYRYDANINFASFAPELYNCSYADIKSIPNEAALHAFYEDVSFIRVVDFKFAIDNLFTKRSLRRQTFLQQ